MTYVPRSSSEYRDIEDIKSRLERLERARIAPGLNDTVTDLSDIASGLTDDVTALTNGYSQVGTISQRVAALESNILYTSLPTNPAKLYPGLTISYQPTSFASTGRIWQMRYDPSQPTYKWCSLGTSPLYDRSTFGQSETLFSSSFVWQDMANTPVIAVPNPGRYVVSYGVHIGITLTSAQTGGQLDVSAYNGTNRSVGSSVGLGATTPPGNYGAQLTVSASDILVFPTATNAYLQVSGSTTTSGIFTTYDRWISLYPIQIG